MGLVYKFHYHGGDTWSFFESSKVLADWAFSDPVSYLNALAGGAVPGWLMKEIGYGAAPRALLMVKILSVFNLFTGGSYWLNSVYLSLFSFCGLWTLVELIALNYPKSGKAALAAFIFLPSALFWGSGVSKETIFTGGFGFLAAWFWPYFRDRSKTSYIHWLAGILLMVLLFQLKYYYMAVFIPVLLSTIICHQLVTGKQHWIMAHLSWVSIFAILLFAATWLHPNLRLDYIAYLIKGNAQDLLARTSGDALIEFKDYPNPVIWMWINLPWAAITGLFRPNLGDWGSFYQNMAILENVCITLLVITAVPSIKGRHLRKPGWLPCAVYVVILSVLLSLSTPNFGTLVRYKVSYLSVLVFLLLYQNKLWDRLVSKLP